MLGSESTDDLLAMKPQGGGGTRFDVVFHYVDRYMKDDPPHMIVILTDGCAAYPREDAAHGIPVLWMLNNNDILPPWGKVARMTGAVTRSFFSAYE